MFDIKQIVETKDLAEAIKNLAAFVLKPEQLKQVEVTDRDNVKHYIAPGLITRIALAPSKKGSVVYYINGDEFFLDLAPEELASQIGIKK